MGKRHQVSLTLNDGRVLQVQQWNNDSVIQESGTGILVTEHVSEVRIFSGSAVPF